jgi:hypothetical protein
VPPQNYVAPNVTFAKPYAQYPQPQQSVAIIGGYAARNMQNVTVIQSNAAQLGEGNANIAYELGRFHLVPPDQFVGGDVQTYYEQGYNYQCGRLEEGGALVSFPFFFNFQLVFAFVCVVFSVFI